MTAAVQEPIAAVSPPDVVVCPELALLIEAARAAAWTSHCNVLGLRYLERKEALARLRGALAGYDARRREEGT